MAPAPRRSADRAKLRDKPAAGNVSIKRAAVLAADQIAQMLAIATPRDAALVAVMTAGACRVGEATLLTWDDLEGETFHVPGGVTKTGQSRTFTLPPEAMAYVETWRQQCPKTGAGWVFPGTPISQPLSIRGAQYVIDRLAKRLGIEGVSSHSFRRSALTAAHSAGLSLRETAMVSGHTNLTVLQKYLDQDAAKVKAEAARALLFR